MSARAQCQTIMNNNRAHGGRDSRREGQEGTNVPATCPSPNLLQCLSIHHAPGIERMKRNTHKRRCCPLFQPSATAQPPCPKSTPCPCPKKAHSCPMPHGFKQKHACYIWQNNSREREATVWSRENEEPKTSCPECTCHDMVSE